MERLYGIQNGSTSFQGNQYEVVTNKSEAPKKTQEQLAAQMGISVDTLQNYKILSEMIPELEELPDSGSRTPDEWLNEQGYRMVISGKHVSIYRVINNTIYIYHIADTQTEYTKLFK